MAQVLYLQSPSGPGSPFSKQDPDPALLTLEGMEELLERGVAPSSLPAHSDHILA